MLGNDGVKIWGVSPGFLATGLNDSTPEQLREVSGRLFLGVNVFFCSYRAKREIDALTFEIGFFPHSWARSIRR